ncbi:hypothetical protein ACCS92_38535, partial [Rhizobium ruizarguesonis]
FNHSDRGATSSINLLSAHDGFTLMDTVSFNDKHNEANGEVGVQPSGIDWLQRPALVLPDEELAAGQVRYLLQDLLQPG